jgi:ribosomal protein S18 acetylase RimI-like enzyme
MTEICPLEPRDLAEAGNVLDLAFGRRGMSESLRNCYELQPSYWFCARRSGQIAGMVGAYGYGRSIPDQSTSHTVPSAAIGSMASIGMMAVHPYCQKQGFGRELMEHLVQQLSFAGYPSLFLEASPAGQHLYPKLGFWPGGATVRMVQQTPIRPRFPAGGAVRSLTARDLPEVIAYDQTVFGTERPVILQSIYERDPSRAFVARDRSGSVAGYLSASGITLGPWAATSPALAEMLLQAALTLPRLGEPRVTFPAENRSARRMLDRYGFIEREGLVHMRLGDALDPRRRADYYGQAGLMLG